MKLCSCNNCDTLLIDRNPQTDAIDYPDNSEAIPMVLVYGGGGYAYWACPKCLTDDCLTDNVDLPRGISISALSSQFEHLNEIVLDGRHIIELSRLLRYENEEHPAAAVAITEHKARAATVTSYRKGGKIQDARKLSPNPLPRQQHIKQFSRHHSRH